MKKHVIGNRQDDLLHAEAGLHFNRVAPLYDQSRAGYPAQLVKDVFAFVGEHKRPDGIEIGCGSGQATLAMAPHCRRLTCIEPGEELAILAKNKVNDLSHVRIFTGRFEDWPESQPVDLIFAANAIQWVNRGACTTKLIRMLRPKGSLAIFRTVRRPSDNKLINSFNQLLKRDASKGNNYHRLPREKLLRQTGCFEASEKLSYQHQVIYDSTTYVAHLATQNRYQNLSDEDREAAFRKIKQMIDGQGGTLAVDQFTLLVLMRRKQRLPLYKRIQFALAK